MHSANRISVLSGAWLGGDKPLRWWQFQEMHSEFTYSAQLCFLEPHCALPATACQKHMQHIVVSLVLMQSYTHTHAPHTHTGDRTTRCIHSDRRIWRLRWCVSAVACKFMMSLAESWAIASLVVQHWANEAVCSILASNPGLPPRLYLVAWVPG